MSPDEQAHMTNFRKAVAMANSQLAGNNILLGSDNPRKKLSTQQDKTTIYKGQYDNKPKMYGNDVASMVEKLPEYNAKEQVKQSLNDLLIRIGQDNAKAMNPTPKKPYKQPGESRNAAPKVKGSIAGVSANYQAEAKLKEAENIEWRKYVGTPEYLVKLSKGEKPENIRTQWSSERATKRLEKIKEEREKGK